MITAHFPHVDEETRDILKAAMDEAKDLREFAEILCDIVCTSEVNDLTTFFAYTSTMGNHYLNARIQDARNPSALTTSILSGVTEEWQMDMTWDDSLRNMAKSIEAAPNDWLACGFYIGWRIGVEATFPESASDFRGLEPLEKKIEEDEEYGFYLSSLYRLRANRLNRERKLDEAIKLYDLAIENAKAHEDVHSLVMCLKEKANLVSRIDVDQGLIILEELRSVSEEWGIDFALYNYYQQLGHVAMARGEFNLSVHYHIKRFEIAKQLGWPLYERGPRIAFLYNMMGNGVRALDLITSHRIELHSDEDPFVLLQEAWAMVNLGNVNDAEPLILKAKGIILKNHDEVRLGLVYLIEGLMEKAQQDFANAMFTVERALDIFERNYNRAFINLSLIHLCDIEIETFDYDKRGKKVELSGPWMTKLEEHVEKNDLPAIGGHLKLLKAKFLYKQAQFKKSEKLVTEVRKISKSQSMEYLDDVAKVLIPEMRK